MLSETFRLARRVASVILATCACTQFAFAESKPVPVIDNNMNVLTYSEFRRLTDEHQREYVESMQKFFLRIEASGLVLPEEVEEAFAPVAPLSPAGKWAWLSSLVQPANADEDCTYSPFKHSLVGTPCCSDASAFWSCRPSPSATSANPATGATPTAASATTNSLTNPTTATESAPAATTSASAPANPSSSFGLNGANTQPSTLNRAPSAQTAEAKKIPGSSSTDSQDAAMETPNNIRCIYAGFPIYGKKCKRQNAVKIGGQDYDCRGSKAASAGATAASAPPVQGTNPDAKKSGGGDNILCNPALFGTKDGKALCVPYAKRASATKACAEISDAKAIEAARKLLKENPQQFDKLGKAMNSVCYGADGTKAAFKQNLQNGGSSQKSLEKSVADVDATCGAFRDQFHKLFPNGSAYGSPPTGSGAATSGGTASGTTGGTSGGGTAPSASPANLELPSGP